MRPLKSDISFFRNCKEQLAHLFLEILFCTYCFQMINKYSLGFLIFFFNLPKKINKWCLNIAQAFPLVHPQNNTNRH